MDRSRSATVRGAIGGALAATVIAVFFLIVDALRGAPLHTPEFLSSVLLGPASASLGVAAIGAYTVLHYAVFIVAGALAGWALNRLGSPASLLLGVVIGFLLFDVSFYAGVVLRGVDVVHELGWPTFLVGNVLGGLVLVGYVGRAGPERRRGWVEVLGENAVLKEGLVAGLIGAAVLAAWFLLLDLVRARLLFTPAALGSALFHGVSGPGAVEYSLATILGYTLVHTAAFLVAGLAMAGLVARSEEHPSLLLALVLLFVTFETLVTGLITIAAAWLLDQLAWWAIAAGNLGAAAAMGYYLWRRHPRVGADLPRAEQSAASGSRGLVTGAAGPGAGRVGGPGSGQPT